MVINSRTHHIDFILDAVTRSSGHSRDHRIDPIILRSWRRCVSDYELVPSANRTARILSGTELQDFQLPIEKFLHIARSGLIELHRQVRPLDYVVLLADANGITVEYLGDERYDVELKAASLYLGSDWNEQHSGSCGVGICATEWMPVTAHQADHFDVPHIGLTCTAAPIFDPLGNPLAVLDVSSLRSPRNKASQHLLLELVKLHASVIEGANFLEHFHDEHWIIRIGPLREYLDVNGYAMIAVDETGMIAGLTPSAKRFLFGSCVFSDPNWSVAIGRNISTIFDTSMTEIIDDRGHPDKELKPIALRTRKAEGFISVTAPRRIRYTPSQTIKRSASNNPATVVRPKLSLDQLVDNDDTLRRSIDLAKRLVNNKINFLIEGETGSGKELFARAIHDESDRQNKPFVAVNCAAIPESLIESELFGYTPGTFTGARRKGMQGLIQQSNGGTLFLDEIGDMPLNLQTRLLRVLSEHELMPLGAEKAIPLDLNVIAATHKDIEQMIADGQFREDLYFRLAGATLSLPALRERADRRYVIESALLIESNNPNISVSPDAMRVFEAYSWPGNIRELRNVLRVVCAICDGDTITPDHFPIDFKAKLERTDIPNQRTHPPRESSYNEMSAYGQVLFEALERNQWNVTDAAMELDISRATIYRHMKRHGIIAPNKRAVSGDS